jgi:bacterioferritin
VWFERSVRESGRRETVAAHPEAKEGTMDKEKIISLLRDDMVGEHQAIIQYLFHAYGMEEGEITCEVEAIAREEMRHLDWLADAIVELGGEPSMDRNPVDFAPGTPKEQLLKDVGLEEIAIAQYRAHIDAIDDPHIRRLLARVLHDELVHKDDFTGLAAEAEEEGVGPAASPDVEPPARLSDIMNLGVRHEYTVILQYLYHSWFAEDKELAEEIENRAINEMQHMGWLSEELGARGGRPDMEHMELFLSHDPEQNLLADIAVEQEVTGDYTSQIPELEDQKLKDLFARIRDHEIYHDAVFKYLLEEVREAKSEGSEEPSQPSEGGDSVTEQPLESDPFEEKPSAEIPSVGSLKTDQSAT